ncbi:MAG: hypothetical protein P8X63_07130 [Desulfuromonadaceae bacterium]
MKTLKNIALAITGMLLSVGTAGAATEVSAQENSLIVCLLIIFCASSIAFQLVPGLIRIVSILRQRYGSSSLGDGSDS